MPEPNLLARAVELADRVLFPRAAAVECTDLVPVDLLDALADAGFYGLLGPAEAGGYAASPEIADAVVAAFAGGCLSVAFVWLQHLGVVPAVAGAPDEVRNRWLAPLCRGSARSGIAISGIRPGVPPLVARRTGEGWRLDGRVPWVTGWGRVDVVHTAAVCADDDSARSTEEVDDREIVWLLVDAAPASTLRAERVHTAAADAAGTVHLVFDGHPVGADRMTRITRYADWQAADRTGLARNGYLAVGVAERCLALTSATGSGGAERADPLAAEVAAARAHLAVAGPDELPAARAAVAELALRCAARLVVARGSRSVRRGDDAERLAREALFLLVFGTRPAIRGELLARLDARSG